MAAPPIAMSTVPDAIPEEDEELEEEHVPEPGCGEYESAAQEMQDPLPSIPSTAALVLVPSEPGPQEQSRVPPSWL